MFSDDPLYISWRVFPICAFGSAGPWRKTGKGGFDQALGQVQVCDGQGGEHDLAGCVVEVGVRNDWAEFEDSASPLVGFLNLGVLWGIIGRVRRQFDIDAGYATKAWRNSVCK